GDRLRTRPGRLPARSGTEAVAGLNLGAMPPSPRWETPTSARGLRVVSVRVFLLGGTGAIGGHALPALVAAGHQVSALARTPEKAAVVRALGADPVMVSMFDRAALSDSFRSHDAVVNLATSMPSSATFVFRRAWRPTERVRIEGSAAVVDAALAAGVPRLLQGSGSMVYPDR